MKKRLIIVALVLCVVLNLLYWKIDWLMLLLHPPKEVVFEDLLIKEDELQEESVVLEGFLLKSKNLSIFTEKINVSNGKIESTGAGIWVEDKKGLIDKMQKSLKKEEGLGGTIYYGKVRLTGQFFCKEKYRCDEEVEQGKGYGHLGAYGCQIIPTRIKILKWGED